jgi:hypothetical protein
MSDNYKDLRVVRATVHTVNEETIKFIAPNDGELEKTSIIYDGEDKIGSHILITETAVYIFLNQEQGSMQQKYLLRRGDMVTVDEYCHREEKWIRAAS